MQGKKRWGEIVLSAFIDEKFDRKSSFSIYEDHGPLVIRVGTPVYDRGRQGHMFYHLALQTSSGEYLQGREVRKYNDNR